MRGRYLAVSNAVTSRTTRCGRPLASQRTRRLSACASSEVPAARRGKRQPRELPACPCWPIF